MFEGDPQELSEAPYRWVGYMLGHLYLILTPPLEARLKVCQH